MKNTDLDFFEMAFSLLEQNGFVRSGDYDFVSFYNKDTDYYLSFRVNPNGSFKASCQLSGSYAPNPQVCTSKKVAKETLNNIVKEAIAGYGFVPESVLPERKDLFEDKLYRAKVGNLYLKGHAFVRENGEVFECKEEPIQRINQLKRDKKLRKDAKVTIEVFDESKSQFKESSELSVAELNMLNTCPTKTVYRSMQYIDGQLLPPMSAKAKGEKLRTGSTLGRWEKAEERPDLAKDGYFVLDKGNGKSIVARYNPYFHCAEDMLNDQFSSAFERPNLVVVECEIPVFELKKGYKAEGAKDAVGKQNWKCGVVQCQFKTHRTIYLSRYIKPVRIVPVEEVADNIIVEIGNRDITLPTNTFTPSVRAALEARGMKFVETSAKGIILEGEYQGQNYSKVFGGKKEEFVEDATFEQMRRTKLDRAISTKDKWNLKMDIDSLKKELIDLQDTAAKLPDDYVREICDSENYPFEDVIDDDQELNTWCAELEDFLNDSLNLKETLSETYKLCRYGRRYLTEETAQKYFGYLLRNWKSINLNLQGDQLSAELDYFNMKRINKQCSISKIRRDYFEGETKNDFKQDFQDFLKSKKCSSDVRRKIMIVFNNYVEKFTGKFKKYANWKD